MSEMLESLVKSLEREEIWTKQVTYTCSSLATRGLQGPAGGWELVRT